MQKEHSFHIPVMGIGFTVDTPLKVAQYGIDSVISLVDDILLEKLRKMYSQKYSISYKEITDKIEDFRAKRITEYLNLINELATKRFNELKNDGKKILKYLDLLPDNSATKQEFNKATKRFGLQESLQWIKDKLSMGSIDVNIMTKVDKENYKNGEKLPVKFNDAHSALRGYANSNLNSSIILSAGMNTRLFSYMEFFDDFYPNTENMIKKKISIKVSDFRSALIQGKFLAKKGLWVSEYRIESGLNCGGHAFAKDGFLLGPILKSFKDKKSELIETIHAIFKQALSIKKRYVPEKPLPVKITVQGGIGTAKEHQFLIDHYKVDSVGWATPFLLVPEVTNVDEITFNKLIDATEDDVYLSNISPLGVPFLNLKNNTKDLEKISLIKQGKPGTACPKKFVCLNNEFNKNLCTASHEYQKLKINELKSTNPTPEEYKIGYEKIVEKACICVGLGTSALLVNNLDTRIEGKGVSVCPGPNIAYFSKILSLKEMIDHIYGRTNVITRTDRPNVFIKELNIFVDFLKNKIDETKISLTDQQQKYLFNFLKNLNEGIDYYFELFSTIKTKFDHKKSNILDELKSYKQTLNTLQYKLEEQLCIH